MEVVPIARLSPSRRANCSTRAINRSSLAISLIELVERISQEYRPGEQVQRFIADMSVLLPLHPPRQSCRASRLRPRVRVGGFRSATGAHAARVATSLLCETGSSTEMPNGDINM
ncbi:hypothetical protein V9T40_000066 [Parthenolecanium corni]|uniref:Uncharacterized protein n=1 Tax=Parthenolecanium corni TaxID=536013 RepID=A0AAN9Y3Y9_9HEMI